MSHPENPTRFEEMLCKYYVVTYKDAGLKVKDQELVSNHLTPITEKFNKLSKYTK